MEGEFHPIYDECQSDDCEGPCPDPDSCHGTAGWSARTKKVVFLTVIVLAVSLSIHAIVQKAKLPRQLEPLPLLTQQEKKQDMALPVQDEKEQDASLSAKQEKAKSPEEEGVDFVYLYSTDEEENASNLAQLESAVKEIREAGGVVRLHKFDRDHDHFFPLSHHYGLQNFPVALIFGPSCCSKFIVDRDFSQGHLVNAFQHASTPASTKGKTAGTACKSQDCK